MITKIEETAALLERSIRDACDVAVLNISGGVDSAVTAAICCNAVGARNVYLVSHIDPELDQGTSCKRIKEVAHSLGAVPIVIPLEEMSERLLFDTGEKLTATLPYDNTLNKRALRKVTTRLSTAILYTVANQLREHFEAQESEPGTIRSAVTARAIKRVRVVGSTNAAEILLGYNVKAGDAKADIMVLGDLFKSEIYQLAKHYKIPELIIQAAPAKTTSLEETTEVPTGTNVRHIRSVKKGESPKANLPYTYEELEPALSALYRALFSGIVEHELSPELPEFATVERKMAQFVIDRFRVNAHKHRATQVVALRNTPYVKDIWAV